MKTSGNKTVRIIVISLILLLIITGAYVVYLKRSADRVRVYDMDSDEISVEVFNPEGKVWDDMYRYPGHPCGAEYSVNIDNNSKIRMSDWTISIEFDGPFEIDSSWNGVFEADGNTLKFTPEGELVVIEPEGGRYFGAVLYSRYLLNVVSYTVTGKMTPDPFMMPLTYLIAFMYALWLVYLGSHILSYAKIESLLKQRAHDIEIIDQSIRTFTSFVDAKDSYTRNHSLRVAIYAKEIGRRIGLDDNELQDLYYGTLLHDVGKIGIPDEILRNKGGSMIWSMRSSRLILQRVRICLRTSRLFPRYPTLLIITMKDMTVTVIPKVSRVRRFLCMPELQVSQMLMMRCHPTAATESL